MDICGFLKSMPDLHYLDSAGDSEIQKAEQQLEVSFADEYKDYLRSFGVATFGSHELTGICQSSRLNVIDVTIQERTRVEHECDLMYVIEKLNVDHVVVWQAQDGSVYQTMPGLSPTRIASSIVEYLHEDIIM